MLQKSTEQRTYNLITMGVPLEIGKYYNVRWYQNGTMIAETQMSPQDEGMTAKEWFDLYITTTMDAFDLSHADIDIFKVEV